MLNHLKSLPAATALLPEHCATALANAAVTQFLCMIILPRARKYPARANGAFHMAC